MKKIFLLLIFITACEIPPPGEFEPENPEGGMVQVDELFVPQDERIIFETNNKDYITSGGHTLWSIGGEEETLVTRKVSASKYSGNNYAGFGFIYAYREDPVLGACMLIVLINIQREYMVGEVIGNHFKEIVPWKESALLDRGYNVNNTIALSYASGEYALSINGAHETNFRDEDEPYHTRGKNGYLVVISPRDNFPDIPVKVGFRELSN